MTVVSKFSLIVALLCAMALAGVTVVESTSARVVLQWEMSGFDTVSVGGGGGLRTALSFDGGRVALGDSGAPLVPGYAIHAGVPPVRGAPRVSVEPIEVATVRLNNPLQIREIPADCDERAPIFASLWISEPQYDNMRDYRAARFVLRPVRVMGQGRVQLLTKARVVIEMPSAPHTGAVWEPHDDYERMVRRLLVNFSAAQGWQSARGLRRAASVPDEPFPFDINRPVAAFRVGDGSRNGNEGTTNENSLIRINGGSVRRALGNGVLMSSVALYASTKGEMDVLVPRIGQIPAGVSEVPILRYDINENGLVDDDDYVIAYVSGASDWGWSSQQFGFALNRFDDYRTYWLAVKDGAGLSMRRFEEPPAGGEVTALETFDSHVFLRTPALLSGGNPEGGADFAWRRFSLVRPDTVIRLDLPGIDESRPGSAQIRPGRIEGQGGAMSNMMDMSLGGTPICENCGTARAEIGSWGSRDLIVRYRNNRFDSKAYYEVNGIHLRYRRFLRLSEGAGKLEIFSPEDPAAARYNLSVSGGAAYVVRVPLDERNVSLIDISDGRSVAWTDEGGAGVRYMAMLERDIVDYSDSLRIVSGRPVLDGRFQIRDLRNTANRADYLIITHGEFLGASLRLAEHKAGMGFALPKVVLTDDVADQFGGGGVDPAALRNFLLYAYRHWDGGDAFSHVVLFGSGHYDYKQAISRTVNFMPVPYISGRFNDDFYVSYDTAYHPSSQHSAHYFLGRLPARSRAAAQNMVEKIIEIEDPRAAEFDAWRNRVLMIADDDQQGAAIDRVTMHLSSSEKTSRVVDRLRPDIDLRKLYLFEYEWDERFFKPGATRALINEINNGVALINWFGHGSMEVIADERTMHKEDIAALHNRKRYPLLSLFSCSIGKFDQPNNDCLASMLIEQPGAGVIASIAGVREVQPTQNEYLAMAFFEALLDTAHAADVSFGSALRAAKHNYNTSSQNRYYALLGDPSLSLFGRGREVGLSVTDSDGAPIDTLKAMQQVTVRGTVRGEHGAKDESFGGPGAYVNVTLFNPPQDSARRKDGGRFTNPIYSLPGSPVFSARIPITNGEFEQQLLLPMNLSFGRPGVKLTAHVWNGEGSTGSGHLGGLIFEGSESGGLTDTAGPKISVRPVYNDNAMDQAGLFVKNRITSQLPLTIEVNIEDESGINVIGTGPDEGLSMEVRGALSRRNINHRFQFAEGSFRQGTAALTYEENTLRSGQHELIISAQDLLGNVSKLTVALDIVDPAELKLDHVINVPNPVRMGRETRFYYYHSNAPGDIDVNVTIRIYSLGGRLLSVIRNPRNGEPWVPRDQKGNLLTPNVYLYQVTAASPNIGRTVKSKIKKLVVHPPR